MKPKTAVIHAMIEDSPHSYAAVARYVDCHKSMIGALATDPRKTCTPVLAQRLAGLLGVRVELLFDPSVPTSKRQDAKQNRRAAA